ncbi:protein lin-37 homolog [Drosophila kikkawai]|uniref:Protein lin-37 homolog n=1 Tax=Drosophila kikkawai TaxID=30033 RepID=A0A6P4JG39_DROKI|nr:protein lin-37 homolog [Drosophila kikkawai]KAH8336661.1 hypothetical protein KR059_000123 [Drosophila kikkawai]
MKTTPKKKEMSLRLRESRREEHKPETSQQQQADDDVESDLPIRGRPSKKLLLQQQQQRRQYQVKLEPDLKTVAAGAASTSGAGTSGTRIKARRTLYKKSANNGAASVKGAGESYVMRLFERSLDLSKYEENTPLYPICRAWMANQPRNPAVAAFNTDGSLQIPKREDNGEEILAKLRSGEIKVLTQLPAPRRTDLPIIPPRLEFAKEDKRLQNASHSDLLSANMARWKKVRAHWLKHDKKYQHERYAIIDQIMAEVCKSNSN